MSFSTFYRKAATFLKKIPGTGVLTVLLRLMFRTTGDDVVRKIAKYSIFVVILTIVNLIVGSSMINTKFPWYSNISIFLLVNINIILLLVLILVIYRNLGKLIMDRKRNIFGARLQSKLVAFSVIIAVLPVSIIFLFSNSIINNSIDKWFDAQIEVALKSSIDLMQKYQNQLEVDLIKQTDMLADIITTKKMLLKSENKNLEAYMKEYLSREDVDGLAIFNNQNMRLAWEDNSFFLYTFVNENILKDIIGGKQLARYEFLGEDQLYWVGRPISSSASENVVTGALFMYKKVPKNQAAKVAKILDSYNNYSQIQFFAQPVKNSYKILLVLITLLVAFAGIWGSLIFAKSITGPLENLADASVEVSKGNLDVTVEPGGDDEISFLINSFNDMIKQLKSHNLELKLKNEKLSEMFAQISRDNAYIDTIFRTVKSAIFLYDTELKVLKSNEFGEQIRQNNEGEFEEQVLRQVREFLASDASEASSQIDMKLADELRTLALTKRKIYGGGSDIENVVVVLDDITDIVDLQRVNIWKEIATRIAHEIKNPLTPIKLTAERIKRKSRTIEDEANRDVFTASMETIINEVNELQSMVDEFNTFARLPNLRKQEFEMCPFMLEIINFYQQGNPGIEFQLTCDDAAVINADRYQLKRVFLNLINNSIHAVENNGRVTIDVRMRRNTVEVVLEDNGCGIREEDLVKIFNPYFSKRSDGTGLGLAIVRKVIDEHNGKVVAESVFGEYTRFMITLPRG